jgi:hypothetical protein
MALNFCTFSRTSVLQSQREAIPGCNLNKSNQLFLLAQTPLVSTPALTSEAVLSFDHPAVQCLLEYFDKRFDAYNDKIERLLNDVNALQSQNHKLNQQMTHLNQRLANICEHQQEWRLL